ncbi:MAG: dynamin family protein [Eubacteriales bacterium]
MSNNYLQIKYHPAKKEIEFHRIQKEVKKEIKQDSVLHKYVANSGNFILQDQGNQFFDDIASAYDGEREVSIKLICTKSDYEDFKQMLEYYNKNKKKCHITATLLAELPDMNITYEMVKEMGVKSLIALEMHEKNFSPTASQDEKVRELTNSFQVDLKEEIKNIQEKIESLQSNNVNLCFAGVYSAGKSTLINAVLGARVLPESIESKTAKMFEISSPQQGDPISITFEMDEEPAKIILDEQKKTLEIVHGPRETEARKAIQETIVTGRSLFCHQQIQRVLDVLNEQPSVGKTIILKYPIPLDNDSLQFTIYDTPGSDSDEDAHKDTLVEALKSQTHSILIYVIAPNKLEGSGNRALLEYLQEADHNSAKTSIDIDRSLFIVNSSDTIGEKDRTSFHERTIIHKNKNNEIVGEIPLKDKKLYFLSAKYALIAKMNKSGIATEEEKDDYEDNYEKYQKIDKERNRYYLQNRRGSSEISTDFMKGKSDHKLREAHENNDPMKVMEISTGIFALEDNIIEYGEKYAVAVKTYAIIDSVETVLNNMNHKSNTLKMDAKKAIETLEKDISLLQNTLQNEIEKTRLKYLPCENKLDDSMIKVLGLSKEQSKATLVNSTLDEIDTYFRKFLGLRTKRENDTKKIKEIIVTQYKKYTDNFISKANSELKSLQKKFIDDLQKAIAVHGELSESAKGYFKRITLPPVKFSCETKPFEAIIDKCSGLIFLNVERLKESVKEQVFEDMTQISDTYKNYYVVSLSEMIDQIKIDFVKELDTFSKQIHAMNFSKEEMEAFEKKINAVARELTGLKSELDQEIWKEI